MLHADFCTRFIPSGGAVLDVGAGRGSFAVAMAEKGIIVSGVEMNPSYIQEAQARALAAKVSIDLRHGRAEQLPYSNNTFDFINCAEVAEDVEGPVAICREMQR